MGTSSIMDLMHNLLTLIEGPELKQSLWIVSKQILKSIQYSFLNYVIRFVLLDKNSKTASF